MDSDQPTTNDDDDELFNLLFGDIFNADGSIIIVNERVDEHGNVSQDEMTVLPSDDVVDSIKRARRRKGRIDASK